MSARRRACDVPGALAHHTLPRLDELAIFGHENRSVHMSENGEQRRPAGVIVSA
jgi:hypothetical protein